MESAVTRQHEEAGETPARSRQENSLTPTSIEVAAIKTLRRGIEVCWEAGNTVSRLLPEDILPVPEDILPARSSTSTTWGPSCR